MGGGSDPDDERSSDLTGSFGRVMAFEIGRRRQAAGDESRGPGRASVGANSGALGTFGRGAGPLGGSPETDFDELVDGTPYFTEGAGGATGPADEQESEDAGESDLGSRGHGGPLASGELDLGTAPPGGRGEQDLMDLLADPYRADGSAVTIDGSEPGSESEELPGAAGASREEARGAGGAAAELPPPRARAPHAAPLPMDPELLRWVDERDEAVRTFRKSRASGGPEDERAELRRRIEELQAKIEARQPDLNRHGFSVRRMGPEFAGEETSMAWRGGPAPAPGRPPNRLVEARRAGQQTLTKYDSVQEREARAAAPDEDGRLRNAAGEVVASPSSERPSRLGYSIDPATGALYLFPADTQLLTQKWVTDPATEKQVRQLLSLHHTTPTAGGAVAGAGEILVDHTGRVTEISNKSGHYKPGAVQMIQTVEMLIRNGAFLDKTWVGADGKALTGKELRLFQHATERQGRVERNRAALLRPPVGGRSHEKIEAEIREDLAKIAEVRRALAKLGAGPSNRVRPVRVRFIEGAEAMTGADVHRAAVAARTTTAQEFLETGAGNDEQAAAKRRVLDELKQRPPKD